MSGPPFRFTKPSKDEEGHINILLLGETGVGKSTFINAFSNYLQFESMEDALAAQQLLCLITAKFTVISDDYKETTVVFEAHNADANEDTQLGNSSTQSTKAYVFPLREKTIRIIDTPGIGDARGVEKDLENVENILDFISTHSHLHAICILVKPNVTVIQAYFKYCVMEVLSRLHKSACRNIVFVFTNTRGTDYKALETWTNLRAIMLDIAKRQHLYIPMKYTGEKDSNVFCFDNEGFKHIVAQRQGVRFGDADIMRKSWEVSTAASWRLINYLVGGAESGGLVPHQVQNSISINECRRLIIELSKPLADISELIQDNITALERHQALVLKEDISIKQLRAALHIPAIDIRQTSLDQPVTICTASKCSKIQTVLGIKKYHYKQRCHNPCFLTNVPKEIIGAVELLQCAAMAGTKTCTQCQCDFSAHMHIYYETETFETTIEDTSVKSQIKSNEDMLRAQYALIVKLEQTSKEYEKEHTLISKSMAKFAHFLKTNSICPINDAYGTYLDYLIGRENTLDGNRELVERYKKMKRQHVEEIQILEAASANCASDMTSVDPEEIFKLIKQLYTLPKTGSKIRDLHKRQGLAATRENRQHCEYVHKKIVKTPTTPKKKPATYQSQLPTKQQQSEWVAELMKRGKIDEAFQLLSLLKVGQDEEHKTVTQPTSLVQDKAKTEASTSGAVPKQVDVTKNTKKNQSKCKFNANQQQKWQPNKGPPRPKVNHQQQPQLGQNLRYPPPSPQFNTPRHHWNNNYPRPPFPAQNFGSQQFANPMPANNPYFLHFPQQAFHQPPNNMGYPIAGNMPMMDQFPQGQMKPQFNINLNLRTDSASMPEKAECGVKPVERYAEPPPPYHVISQKNMQESKAKLNNAKKLPPRFKKETMHKQALQEDNDSDDSVSSQEYVKVSQNAKKADDAKIKMIKFLEEQRKIVNAKLKEKEEQAEKAIAHFQPLRVSQPIPTETIPSEDRMEKILKLVKEMFKK